MLSPEEFVTKYHNLKVNCLQPYFGPPIYCAENKTLAIVRYVSGLTTYTQSVRERIREFLNAEAAKSESGVTMVAAGVWSLASLQIEPIYSFSEEAFVRALNGRGSIWEIQCTLRVASLMMASYNTDKHFYGAHDLQTFVNYFVGMDCNGFVGAYLREVAGANPGSGSLSCAELASGPKRSHASEVRERDFIFHQADPNHISMVGSIEKCEGDWVHCKICEARSPKFKGPQTLPWKIKRDGADWKMYRTDMSGLPTRRTWISRNAMVG